MFHNLFKKKPQDDKTSQVVAVIEHPIKLVSPPVVIFDFDGALANSLRHILAAVNDFAKSRNITNMQFTTYQELVMLRDNAIKMLNIKDVGKLALAKAELVRTMADKLSNSISDTAMYGGVKEAVTQLRETGVIVGVVTTNRAVTVMEFLKLHGSDAHFNFIVSSEGVDKTAQLNALAKERKLTKETTFYVSGRTDYFPAVKSIAQSVGAVWGQFDNKESFVKAKADHIVATPDELFNLVQKHHQLLLAPSLAEAPVVAAPAIIATPEPASTSPRP